MLTQFSSYKKRKRPDREQAFFDKVVYHIKKVLREGNVARLVADQQKYNIERLTLKVAIEKDRGSLLYCAIVSCKSSSSLDWLIKNMWISSFREETKKNDYNVIDSFLLHLAQIEWDKEQTPEEKTENFKFQASAIEKLYLILTKVPEMEEYLESQLKLPAAKDFWEFHRSKGELSCLERESATVVRMAINLFHAKIKSLKPSRSSA